MARFMIGDPRELDQAGAAYLERLTDADLAAFRAHLDHPPQMRDGPPDQDAFVDLSSSDFKQQIGSPSRSK